jgi:hypothetical protein
MKGVNLLEHTKIKTGWLGRIRLDKPMKPIVLFTLEGEACTIHYCNEPEILGYVHCLGAGCVLCRIGKRKEDRYLLPVLQEVRGSGWEQAMGRIKVLPIPLSLGPGDLFLQILEAGKDVSQERLKRISVLRLGPSNYLTIVQDACDGLGASYRIREFMTEWQEGRVSLTSVYDELDNDELLQIDSITMKLWLKERVRK